MTDRTAPPVATGPEAGEVFVAGMASDPAAQRAKRRHVSAGTRVAAAGLGFTAMLGLAANMEFAKARSQVADAGKPSAASSGTTVVNREDAASASGSISSARESRPIVLTAHAVVRIVKVQASGGSGGSGYVAASSSGGSGFVSSQPTGGSSGTVRPAPAPAAAPVASTSGSH